uniref:DUF6087 family protein n=1 Tax=Streptomyces sp. CHD11 TaxID=2741325 RepID=UPI00203E4434|nr:DUF6087 family protein [Streptomyces sp. CHD11]
MSRWAERRAAKVGRLRAVPLTGGDGPQGAHLTPDAPRVIPWWNGYLWEPYALTVNLAEAKRILFPSPEPTPAPRPVPLTEPGHGTGRHRKPQAPR